MKQFAGLEPLVGEIVGLRTFRVDESGLLLPLYSNLAWYDGPNTATCVPPTGEPERSDHPVPAPDCECGFYAYGTAEAAERIPGTRYVEAVVSCWGRALAEPVRPVVAAPSCRGRLNRAGGVLAGVALLGLGLLPTAILCTLPLLWDSWLTITTLVAAVTAWLLVAARGVGHLAAAAVSAGVLGWLAAPLFGPTGWLLRVPLLRGVLVAGGGSLLRLRPGYFPVVRSVRDRRSAASGPDPQTP